MTREELKEYLLDTEDYREDEIEDMSAMELFDAYLTNEGIIGFSDSIMDAAIGAFNLPYTNEELDEME